MLGSSIFWGYLILAVVVGILRWFQVSGPQLLLGSLTTYYSVDPASNPATKAKPEDLKTKKGRKQFVKQQLEFRGQAQQIYRQTMTFWALKTLWFGDDINAMVFVSLGMVVNSVMVLLGAVVFGWGSGVVTVGMALMLVLFTIYALIKVEYAVERRTWVDSTVLLVVFGVCGCVALGALTWAPYVTVEVGELGWEVPLLPFDVRPAARGFDMLMHGLHVRVAERAKVEVPKLNHMNPLYITLAVAVWAGMLGVAMLGPAIQYSKLFYRSVNVPTWAEAYQAKGWGTIKLMQLAFLAPVAVAVSQILPLFRHWGVEPEYAPYIAAGLLLLVAVTHYLTTPPLCQSYLDIGLNEWYQLLHSGLEFEGKAALIKARLDYVRTLLGKTCVQLLSPSVLAGSLGLLLLLNAGVTEKMAAASVAHREAAVARLPPNLAHLFHIAANPPAVPAHPDVTVSIPLSKTNVTGLHTATDTAPETEGLLGLTEDGSEVHVADVSAGQEQDGKAKEETVAKDEAVKAASPTDLWRFLGHFLGWWTCVVWSVYACSSLAVYRLGLNSG